MKNYWFLLCMLVAPVFLLGQKNSFGTGFKSFTEVNSGLAFANAEFLFPGASWLIGQTYIDENNHVIEYEIGLAAPSIGTAKFGVGGKIKNTLLTGGIRLFPFNFYVQSAFGLSHSGYWLISLEANPLPLEHYLSLQSAGLITVGYRFNLGRSDNDEQ